MKQEVKVSKTTKDLMQAIGRMQAAYFEVCGILDDRHMDDGKLLKSWNTLNDELCVKIGFIVMEVFGETGGGEI